MIWDSRYSMRWEICVGVINRAKAGIEIDRV